MSALDAPIAIVDPKRQISYLDLNGKLWPQTRAVEPALWDAWGSRASDTAAWQGIARKTTGPPRPKDDGETTWSWPTFSPDGRKIACFRFGANEAGQRTSFVHVLDTNGVSAADLAELGRRLPIYLQWAPAGDRVAVLSQRDDRLGLSVVHPDRVGEELSIAEGSPLFFTWAATAPARLMTFVGNTAGGRMALQDPRAGGPTALLPGRPGNFCAPVWLEERAIYVAWHEGATHVVSATVDSPQLDVYEEVDGLVALVPAPGGRPLVARAVAPGGDGTPYRHLAVIDVTTRTVTKITDRPCLAFLWTADASALLLAHVDTDRNLLIWERVELDGTRVPFAELHPSRDLGFYLRFFEQYALSHPLVDPSGRHLLLSGTIPGRGDESQIWQIDLESGRAEAVADGLFAVYGPNPPG